MRPLPATLDVDPRRLLVTTIGAVVVAELALLTLYRLLAPRSGPVVDPLRELFDLTRETSLSNWFAMAQLMMISLTLWLIYAVVKNRGARATPWLVLATFFSCMTFANGARLHRRLGGVTQWLMDSDLAEHVLWALLVVPLGLFTVVFLWRVLRGRSLRTWLLVAVAGFVVAAITGAFAHAAVSNLLEIAACTVLWFLLLTHAGTSVGEYHVRIDDAPPPTAGAPSTFHISRSPTIRRVFLACILIELVLVLADYHVNLRGLNAPSELRAMFNLARENSLPNWFSATQTLMAAITAWLVLLVVRARAGSTAVRRGWLILALFFSYMAVDDGSRIHEQVGRAFRALLEGGGGSGLLQQFPSYAWQVFFVPLFGAAGLFTVVFLVRHSRGPGTRAIVLLAVGLLGLAVGLDFLEGLDREHPWNPYTYLANNFDLELDSRIMFRHSAYFITRHFSKVIEEILEMFATTLLWSVFLGHLFDLGAQARIRVARG
jgi:hypothetical protein